MNRRKPAPGSGRPGLATLLLAIGVLLLPGLAHAQPAGGTARPRIGLVTSLSGQSAYIGTDIRDGFLMALSIAGKAHGREIAEVLVRDDAIVPEKGLAQARDLLRNEGVRLFTGVVSTNIAVLVVPELLQAGALFVSPNAAPKDLSGRTCHPRYFVTSYHNDSMPEIAAKFAAGRGFRRAYLISASFQAGLDAVESFRQHFGGQIVGESIAHFGQVDFSQDLQKIREARPDVILQFLPGSIGVAFLRGFHEARLSEQIAVVLPSSALDHRMLAVAGSSAAGLFVTAHWNRDFGNPANRRFVQEWQSRYNRVPTLYAMQGFDAGQALAAAILRAGGQTDDPEIIARHLGEVEIASPRGMFRFGRNRHPVQDWWLLSVKRDPQGQYQLVTDRRIAEGHADSFAGDCPAP